MQAKIIFLLVIVGMLISGCTSGKSSAVLSSTEQERDYGINVSSNFSLPNSSPMKDESEETKKLWIHKWKSPHLIYQDSVGNTINKFNIIQMNAIVCMLNRWGFLDNELKETAYIDLDQRVLYSLLMESKNSVDEVKAEKATLLYQKYNLSEPVAFLSKNYVDESVKRFFCSCLDRHGYKINLNSSYKVGDKMNYSTNYYVEHLAEDGVYAISFFGEDMDKYISVITNCVQKEEKYILTYVHSVASINDVAMKTENGTAIGEKKPFNGWQIFDDKIMTVAKIDYQFCIEDGVTKLHAIEVNSKG